MIKPAVLDAMVAAGCTAEQIAAAVKADQSSSSGASRQARYRARKAAKSDDSDVTSVTDRNADVTNLSPKETSPTPPKEITPIQVSEPDGSSTVSRNAQFADWWECYPRKVSKADARKQFDKALTVTDFATLMASVRRFAIERQGADQQFTMHPDRWLRGQHWNDEAPRAPMPRSGAPPSSEPRTVSELALHRLQTGRSRNEPSNHSNGCLDLGDGGGQAESSRGLQLIASAGNAIGRIGGG